MTKIKFDVGIIKYISLFESITRTHVKDCIVDEKVIFVVAENEISKAIGKAGSNVKKVEKALNRKIKIVEFNPKPITFIKNFIYPLKVKDITEDDGIITIVPIDSNTRGLLIGRNAQNLRETESIVKRYFDIKEIKVV